MLIACQKEELEGGNLSSFVFLPLLLIPMAVTGLPGIGGIMLRKKQKHRIGDLLKFYFAAVKKY